LMNWRHFQAQTDKGTLKAVMQLKLLAVCVYRILVIVCHDRNKGENMPNSAMNSTTTVKCRATRKSIATEYNIFVTISYPLYKVEKNTETLLSI